MKHGTSRWFRSLLVSRRVRERSGHAVIETTLLAPWIFFLFVGVLDFGFYAYAAIATQNAARVAALATASSDTDAGNDALACLYAREEMERMPNSSSMADPCTTWPLKVDATKIPDPSDPSGTASASRVSVTYQTIPMIPIPGLLMGQMTINRLAEVKVYGG